MAGPPRREGGAECFFRQRAATATRGILDQDMIDLGRESFSTLERVAATPSSGLGSVRLKPTKEDCNRIFEIFRAHDVRYFFYIGGNDSAETAHIIAELARESDYEFRVAHIPKTIDNDLRVTDHCPGFGSAARFVSLAFRGDDLDNRAIHGVKINIVMGRHAGFLTAAAAIGIASRVTGNGRILACRCSPGCSDSSRARRSSML